MLLLVFVDTSKVILSSAEFLLKFLWLCLNMRPAALPTKLWALPDFTEEVSAS